MKIVYSTPALYLPGGVERVLTTKVNYLADVLGHDVTVVLTDGAGREPYYALSPRIRVVQLDIGFERMWNRPLWQRAAIYAIGMLRYRRRLRRVLMELRADIVVTTMRREVNFIADIPDGSRKVGELHVTRSHYRNFEANESSPLRRIVERLWTRQLVERVRKLDALVVLTEGERAAWPEVDNVVCIPNPLPFPPFSLSDCQPTDGKAIAVGRYCYQKGFDLLLRAWADVHRRHPEWQLDIYGSGDRTPYERLCHELSLDDVVTLYPADDDIRQRYAESGLFVLSSRFEGFGMVVIEAMACGLPVVSFDCPTGPAELIEDGRSGLLAADGDVEALASTICRAIADPLWRQQASAHALRRADDFCVERTMQRWSDLFASLTS